MNNKICEICGSEGKYKCPTCLIFYCSVTCCRKHRANNCDVLIREENNDGEENLVHKRRKIEFSESSVSDRKLELLRSSEEVNKILTNSHLRTLLVAVDNSDKPDEIMQKAMQEPIFVEFADACLKVVEPETAPEDDYKTD